MKGFTKALKRAPHLVSSKVGMASKSSDPQFDALNQRFTQLEKLAEKLLKDSNSFKDSVKSMLMSGANFGRHFDALFKPIGNEYDLERRHPNSTNTLVNISAYLTAVDELKDTLTPEIELLETRVVSPASDFTSIVKAIRKNITKRDHKLIDYDRHNNSYSKLRDKKEKTLKDEQNLYKLEQEYETSTADYEYYNNVLKEELPRFFEMAERFMTPLFHSFYYMQLNVFYLTMERLQSFIEGRYDMSNNTIQAVESHYLEQLTDAAERLEALSIRKGAIPSARILASSGRSPSLGSPMAEGLAANAPSRAGGFPSRQPSSPPSSVPPPAYTSVAATKRAPPPPPIKPKPDAAPEMQYVVALYDYAATADGDLSFRAGDRIEVVERTASTEDWWTGIVNGHQGIFPGNYVREE